MLDWLLALVDLKPQGLVLREGAKSEGPVTPSVKQQTVSVLPGIVQVKETPRKI